MLKGIVFVPHPPVIIPEVGKGAEQEINNTIKGMKRVVKEIAHWQPEVIICISPHGNAFRDAISVLDEPKVSGSLAAYGYFEAVTKSTPQELKSVLQQHWLQTGIPHIFLSKLEAKQYQLKLDLDHGALVPLYFVEKEYSNYQLLHITPGFLTIIQLYKAGIVLGNAIRESGKSTVIIASGDLSHCLLDSGPYSYNPAGPQFDKLIKQSLNNNNIIDLLSIPSEIYEPAGQCGLRSYALALGAADGLNSHTEVFSYEGPFGVGYLTGKLELQNSQNESLLPTLVAKKIKAHNEVISQEDAYVRLARYAIEEFVKSSHKVEWQSYIKNIDNSEFINRLSSERAGAFVSIHSNGQLRGCIGTIQATQVNLASEIIKNAIQAAVHDPRFTPIISDELYDLEIKVDILLPLEIVSSVDELDVKKYGVVVESGSRRGLLLPDLAGIDTVAQQLQIAKQKAGINPSEKVKLYKFEVERH